MSGKSWAGGCPPRGDHVICEFDQPPVEHVFSHVASLAGRDNALVTLLGRCTAEVATSRNPRSTSWLMRYTRTLRTLSMLPG